MRYHHFIPATATLLLLSACGGSGGSNPIVLDDVNGAFDELFTLFESEEEPPLQTEAELVAQGSASYEGFALSGVNMTDDVFVGRASINATFTDGGSVTGTIGDLVHFIDDGSLSVDTFEGIPDTTELTEIDGQITLGGGALTTNSDGPTPVGQIAITLSGNVVVPAEISVTENQEDYTIEGDMNAFVEPTDRLIGVGSYTAESSDAGFDGFLYILAD